MEGQLTDLRCSYEGWISIVAQASLPKQHPMTERDIQAQLEILSLVYKEPQRPLMAMDEDPSHRGTPEMAMMLQLIKAMEDDYTKLKGSQYLLKCPTPSRGLCEEAEHKQASSPVEKPSTPSQSKEEQESLDNLAEAREECTHHLPPC